MPKEYTINQALQELKISKATLYYRINKFRMKLENHISMKDGKKYISLEGLEILKANNTLDDSPNSSDEDLDCLYNNQNCSDTQGNKDSNKNYDINYISVVEILIKENEFLKSQILDKDNHIQTLTKLLENRQVLLKQEKDKVLLLEDYKKSWWKRLFRH